MDIEIQKDEITALESIYNKEEFSYSNEDNIYQCNFKIFISLSEEYYLTYKDNRCLEEFEQKVQISHLPPLSLDVTLPENYPSTSPPLFSLSAIWLCHVQLAKLCKKLDSLWEENKSMEILFVWFDFLQNKSLQFLNINKFIRMDDIYTSYKIAMEKAQILERYVKQNEAKNAAAKDTKNSCKISKKIFTKQCYKRIDDSIIDKRASSDCSFGKNPIQAIIDYNEERNHIEFLKSLYTCAICFTDKLGEHCFKFLPCSHVFCKTCIVSYLEVKIKDGNVQKIFCPDQTCTSEATPGQIKDLVSPEVFARYDSMLLNIALDTMTDIVYCPRRLCQYPVSRDLNESFANCPACRYVFCIYCKMVYHGIEPCKIASGKKQQLVTEYQTASEEQKLKMEKKYGKKQLQMLVENTMSENWIQKNSKNCPRCFSAIEKSDGCNKMTCYKCNTYFCWTCGIKLNQNTPYLHFSDPNSPCHNMLYHGVTPDEDDDGFFFLFPDAGHLQDDDLEYFGEGNFDGEYLLIELE